MNSVIKRILICDDVADNSFLLKAILEADDCYVDIVDSGTAVLAFLEANPSPPDLLILDVMMPQMNGYEVAQRIRQSENFQSLPILLVTGVSSDYISDEYDVEIDGFIQKPIDADVVIAQVKAIWYGADI